MLGASNGWYKGAQHFACPENRGVFVPLTHVKLDDRFSQQGQPGSLVHPSRLSGSASSNGGQDFGELPCPSVVGFVAPVKVADVAKVAGRNKGIQGHQNSCYLDATLFAMFSFTR